MNIKLDANGEIAIENGELVFVTGQEELTQFIGQKLKTFFGEWFLDLRLGIPYFEVIFQKQPDPAVIDAVYINEITDTPGVTSLREFDANLNKTSRTMSVDFQADTVDGEINFSEVLT